METVWSLPYAHRTPLPDGEADEFRTPDALVERALRRFSDPGAVVFDPFAGYGTTLRVAAELDREPYGLEFDSNRAAFVRDRVDGVDGSSLKCGDVLEADLGWVPPVECCLTSPPFMVSWDDRNPFRNYEGEGRYHAYLADVERGFERVAGTLAPGGTLLVDVANLRVDDVVTTLAWDLADRIRRSLSFEQEVVIDWENPEAAPDEPNAYAGYDHTYLLVFERESGSEEPIDE